jgi:subtilisin-like proprotein convertase family protein
MKSYIFISFFGLFIFSSSYAQTKEDVLKITKEYNLVALKNKAIELELSENNRKNKALVEAKKNNWPEFIRLPDGNIEELMDLTPAGLPIYYATSNANAAISTRANHLNTGGSMGLNLNGLNMVPRVWDGGTVRRSHNSFNNRVETVDDTFGTSYNSHATHVAGTILASNAVASTKGMAYQATGRTFNWTNDESESVDEAVLGMLISNHSYGVPLTSTSGIPLDAAFIGSYGSSARDWDEITYLAPYYLPVMSAGNSGNDNNNANPIQFGFDKLTGNKTAKNVLIVANAQDATISSNGSLISVQINSSSSQGPTDDFRIKPDIAGNGTNVLSTSSGSNTATATLTGTSMASPNVAGTLVLLQEHYKNVTSFFMKAATLRGLACHTADDAGNVGPDARFGWGLLNAKKAAESITNNGLSSWISEENLAQSGTYSMTVNASGTEPLIASITWTDLPGIANNGALPENDPTPALVNNLDIKIIKDGSQVFFPWRLNPFPSSLALRNDDNNVDNIEVVKIDNPIPGNYTIQVTHKNTLVTGKQDFSLVVTGLSSAFSLIPTSDDLELCSNQNAVYTFDYKQIGAFTTTFSAVNLPNGAVATFNPATLNTDGLVTMTISNLTIAQGGLYNVGIQGDNGIETEIRTRKLELYSTNFQPTNLISPTNQQNTVSTTILLNWQSNFNAENYKLQVSTSPNFSTFMVDVDLTENSFLLNNLNQSTNYYWRVTPYNRCGIGSISNATINTFQTGLLVCGSNFNATNFSDATIGTTANSNASVPIQVSGGFTIGDLNVVLNISHTYIQDITIKLEGPASIGSPSIILFSQPCGDNDDINCTIDDAGTTFICSSTSPSISGIIKPFQNLSNLNGLIADGTWTLRVNDAFNTDGGSINGVTLSFCKLQTPLSIDEYELSKISIYPNPTNSIININLNSIISGETNYTLFDIQGRSILEKKSNNPTESIDVSSLTDGVYLLSISNGNIKTTEKIVVKK